ncbi:hypothetical protein LPJ58_002436 [Coemansia sp. RSA 1591]|nr:hypothetical protein LPJ58_002436 [Coemansia sp. RSA 1591]KAJ2269430.1 hypothetical protein GGH14_005470 [Coemansia sp. RSA 370]
MSVWRHPISLLKSQQRHDNHVFETKRRHVVYQYMAQVPRAGHALNVEEYVLGLHPVPSVGVEVGEQTAQLRKQVQELERAVSEQTKVPQVQSNVSQVQSNASQVQSNVPQVPKDNTGKHGAVAVAVAAVVGGSSLYLHLA